MKKRLVMGTLTAALIAGSVPYEIYAQQEVMIQSEEGGPEEPSEPEQPEPENPDTEGKDNGNKEETDDKKTDQEGGGA